MDLASVVSTALGIVFILQIIIIIQVSSLMKRIKSGKPDFPTAKPFKKERNIKEGKKAKRPQEPEKQAPVTSVEKSLRDINLRLKNAERDQERARKKLSVPDSRGPRKKPGRDGQRRSIKRREGGRKNQNYRERPAARTHDKKTSDTFKPSPPIKEETPQELIKQTPAPVSQSNSSSEQGFGRGSKVTVKRRTLENGKNGEKSPDEKPSAVEVTKTEKEQDISFGRR
jgi:hypothetical protein